jgi:uncharacterized repeat protein (TIGR01451 family)
MVPIQSINKLSRVAKISLSVAVTLLGGIIAGTAIAHAANLALPASCSDTSNEVVYCGAPSVSSLISKVHDGDGHNSGASIQAIYDSSSFGISPTAINELAAEPAGTSVYAGSVTKTGDVYISGKSSAVAISAVTAGRDNIAGSTPESNGGLAFYVRPTAVSFQQSSLTAYVVMTNGKFAFAILSSCGNPVRANAVVPPAPTPTPKPAYTITKTVALEGSSSFSKSVTVTDGSTVTYRVTVASSGTGPVTNLAVKDTLPTSAHYIAGTLTRDGAAVNASSFFSNGVTVASLVASTSTTFQFNATVGDTSVDAHACTDQTIPNTATSTATGLPTGTSTATVYTQCSPTPLCTNFVVTEGTVPTVDGTSTTQGVTVTEFNYDSYGATFDHAIIHWDDNLPDDLVSNANQIVGQPHPYPTDGTYTISISLYFDDQNGNPLPVVNSPSCQQQVTFSPAPATPPTPPAPTVPTPVIQPVAATQVTSLIDTGPGSIAGIFVLATLVSGFGYRYYLSRKLADR